MTTVTAYQAAVEQLVAGKHQAALVYALLALADAIREAGRSTGGGGGGWA